MAVLDFINLKNWDESYGDCEEPNLECLWRFIQSLCDYTYLEVIHDVDAGTEYENWS